MFLWDIAPWMRHTTAQLNDIIHKLSLMLDLLVQQTKDLSPEQQKMLNDIYAQSVATKAKMDAAVSGGSQTTPKKG